LDSGKPADAAVSNGDNGKTPATSTDKTQPETAKPAVPAKKKGRFHALKKVVDPF
jgi:hypothetical protein